MGHRPLQTRRDRQRRQARSAGRASGWGLTLSVIGVLAVPVAFWSGLPLLLGTAGILLGTAGRGAARDAGRGTAVSGWAVGVGSFAIVACLAIGIVGTLVVPPN